MRGEWRGHLRMRGTPKPTGLVLPRGLQLLGKSARALGDGVGDGTATSAPLPGRAAARGTARGCGLLRRRCKAASCKALSGKTVSCTLESPLTVLLGFFFLLFDLPVSCPGCAPSSALRSRFLAALPDDSSASEGTAGRTFPLLAAVLAGLAAAVSRAVVLSAAQGAARCQLNCDITI